MPPYTIINSTGSALASGGVTTAAHTIETGIMLTASNLAIVAALIGVAVMQDASTTAEKTAVADEILTGGAGTAPSTDFSVANGTLSALTNVNAAGDDVPVEKYGDGIGLTTSELLALLGTAGVFVAKTAPTNALRRKASNVLKYRKALSL